MLRPLNDRLKRILGILIFLLMTLYVVQTKVEQFRLSKTDESLSQSSRPDTPEGSGNPQESDGRNPTVLRVYEPQGKPLRNLWKSPSVQFRVDPAKEAGCSTESGCNCTEEYLAFVDQVRNPVREISERELQRQILIQGHERPPEDISVSPEALRQELMDVLQLRRLMDNFSRRKIRVTVGKQVEDGFYLEKELLIEDPFVGVWKARLLAPTKAGPFPGLLALHGHSDFHYFYSQPGQGYVYPARGYAVLIPTQRAMCCDADEGMVTRAMLLNGFTFQGVRVYEALVGIAVLKALPEVDPARIGVIGHSAGSVTGNLLIRITPQVKALVSDCKSHHIAVTEEGWLLDETVPAMRRLIHPVHQFRDCPTPVLEAPYDYPQGMEAVFDFFDRHLR